MAVAGFVFSLFVVYFVYGLAMGGSRGAGDAAASKKKSKML